MKLLIADADKQQAEQLARHIIKRHPDWYAQPVTSLSDCEQAFAQNGHGIVLWDLNMPEGGGLSGLQRLRELAPRAYIIVTVSAGDELLGARVLLQGADYYIARHEQWDEELIPVVRHAQQVLRQRHQHRNLQAQARYLQNTYQTVIAGSGEAIIITSPAGIITSSNQATQQLLDYSGPELAGQHVASLFTPPEDFRQTVEYLLTTEAEQELPSAFGLLVQRRIGPNALQVRGFVRRGDHHYQLCDIRVARIMDEENCRGLVVSIKPVAEREVTAPHEFTGRGLMKALLQYSPNYTLLCDPEGIVIEIGDQLRQQLGDQATQIIGHPPTQLVEVLPQFQDQLDEVLQHGGSFEAEGQLCLAKRQPTVRLICTGIGTEGEVPQAVLLTAVETEDTSGLAAELQGISAQLVSLVTALERLEPTEKLPALAEKVLVALGHLLPYDAALSVIRIGDGGAEPITAYEGFNPQHTSELAGHLTNNLSQYKLSEQSVPTLIDDWETFYRDLGESALQELVVREGLRSGGVLPLRWGRELVGIVFFGFRDHWIGTETTQHLLQLFGIEAAIVVGTALERRQTERSSDLVQRLMDITTAISAGEDLSEVMQRIVRTASEVCSASCAWIEILDKEHAQFEQTFTHWPDRTVAEQVYVQVHDLAWSAVRQSQIVHRDLPAPESSATHNVTSIPLRIDQEIVGVLTVARPVSGPPAGTQQNILQLVTAQAAVAVHNARLRGLADQRSKRLEAAVTQAWEEEARARTLFEAATAVTETSELREVLNRIASNAATTIGFERVRIYLADHDERVLRGAVEARSDGTVIDISDQTHRLQSGENPLVDAALSTAPYIIVYADSQQEVDDDERREQLFVSLRAHGTLVGTIAADNPHSKQSISPQKTRLLRALAGMASVAIDRAQTKKARELFISVISHELRTPLASLQAYTELIIDEEVGPVTEEQKVYLGRVERARKRLGRVIEDLMSWSRLQAGEISIDKRPADVRQSVTSVLETLRPQAARAQVQVKAHLPEEAVTLVTDAHRVEQILLNLVDNAIRYNQQNGRVEVTVRKGEEDVTIEVADTGPGISPSMQDKIFEAFNRGPEAIRRSTQGVGLGLAMAARMAEYLGGELTVQSEPGVGSSFFLRLPRNSSGEGQS